MFPTLFLLPELLVHKRLERIPSRSVVVTENFLNHSENRFHHFADLLPHCKGLLNHFEDLPSHSEGLPHQIEDLLQCSKMVVRFDTSSLDSAPSRMHSSVHHTMSTPSQASGKTKKPDIIERIGYSFSFLITLRTIALVRTNSRF